MDRAVEPVDQGDRGRDRTDGQRRVAAGDDEPAAGKVDQQRAELGEHAHHHAEPLAAAGLLEVQLRDLLIDRAEALVFLLLAGEELDQQRAADGQGLVHELVHLVVLGLARAGELPAGPADAAGGQDQQRDHDQTHQGELPAHREQGDQGRDDRCHVAHDLRQGPRDDRAHAADVGVHAGDDVALPLGGEEGVGHVLEMVVHLVAHVEDDALGDPGVDIALQHADDLRDRQGHKGHQQKLDQQLHVLSDERLVHDASGDDRGQQADGGREQDRHEYKKKLQPIGLEIG